MNDTIFKTWIRIFWIVRQLLLRPIPDLTKDQDESLYLCALQIESYIELNYGFSNLEENI